MSKCTKCGNCCIAYERIPLTFEEAESKRYSIITPVEEGLSARLTLKPIYFAEWDATIQVCIYFAEKTRECLIYEDRPKVCRKYFCTETKHVLGRIMKRIFDTSKEQRI